MNGTVVIQTNPWADNLDNYHLWCCPECDYKTKTKEHLIHHGLMQHPAARLVFQKPKPQSVQFPIKTFVTLGQESPESSNTAQITSGKKIEKRFIDFGFKERKDVVQCYHCGTMLPRDEMFLHMEQEHGKFYSHMCGPPRAFQCSVCRRTMETEKQHASHRCQEAKGHFKCDNCKITFEWRSGLVDHLNKMHNIRAKIDVKATRAKIEKDKVFKHLLRCENCQIFVKSQKKLEEHVKEKHPPPPPQKVCKICLCSFHDDNALAKHVTQYHTLNYFCDECNNEFPDAIVLNRHQQGCLFETRCFSCQKCDSFWNSNSSLKLHYSESHNLDMDVCGLCGHATDDAKNMNNHWKEWHENYHRFHCDYCAKEFFSQGSLDNHTVKVHKIATSLNCEICEFHCGKRTELESHVQNVHGSVMRFFCEICQFWSFEKNKLTAHKRKSHRFVCGLCHATFETVREKNQHEKDHNEIKRRKMKS